MKAGDVTDTLELALAASGLDKSDVNCRPRLLSDNGSSYVAGDLAKWMSDHDMKHIRRAPYHPMTQGKIEPWHQTLKNRTLARDRAQGIVNFSWQWQANNSIVFHGVLLVREMRPVFQPPRYATFFFHHHQLSRLARRPPN